MSLQSDLQIANEALARINGALGYGATPATPYSAPTGAHIPATAVVVGDMVNIHGRLFTGVGRVKKILVRGDAKFKAAQNSPQFLVKAANGKTFRYNGDDLASGVVAFARKPNGTDLRNFAI